MRKNSLIEVVRIRRVAGLWLLGIVVFASAFSITAGGLTAISQSYSSSENVPMGSIVSLQKNTTDQVIAANSNNIDNILGVVINTDNSLLTISNGQANQVQIATSGTVQVLVSDINGTIYRGDHITASPINGVGMKATSNVRVVGVAQSDLASSTSNSSNQTYTDKDGKKHTIVLGEVPVLVNVAYYFKEPDKTVIPSALQNIANALAGKTVSTLPIVISSAIFIVTIITAASMIYSMIHSSIISVGRNPMSQSAVYRNLIQLVIVVLIVLAVGFSSIYLILTRL